MFLYEKERFGTNNNVDVMHGTNFTFPIHVHRSFEFVYVKKGEIEMGIDEQKITLKEDEVILVFPNQLHSYYTLEESEIIVCIFAPEIVNEFYLVVKNKKQKEIVKNLENDTLWMFLKNINEISENIYLAKSLFYAICSEIYKKTELVDRDYSRDILIWHKLMIYLENNFTKDISLKKLATEFGYDYRYFSRKTNRSFNISFPKLLNEYRINCANYLIRNTENSITEISYACGYKNIRTFNRAFLDINKKTPTEFKNDSSGAIQA